ncbi:MAG: DUF4058 family protein [Chloroflexota bacterium]
MPSPFPGMDPYLEGNEWTSFHNEFGLEIARQLRPALRPRYLALTIRRSVTDAPDDLAITAKSDNVYPDIGVIERSPVPLLRNDGGVSMLEPTLQVATQMPEIVPQVSVEIRDVEERQLVTLVEILSPVNKRGHGYREYAEKRTRILLSTSHLLGIDLLRNGTRVPMRQELPNAPYFVFLSRWQKRPITDVWEIGLNQSLPSIPIPLLPEDDDVALDLQQAFSSVYDSVAYDLLLEAEYSNTLGSSLVE